MKIFILGLIFGLFIQPLLDGFTSLILSFFEMIKGYFALKIAQNNQKIQNLSTDAPTHHTIGFALREEVEDDDI